MTMHKTPAPVLERVFERWLELHHAKGRAAPVIMEEENLGHSSVALKEKFEV